jgi:hypothetical protein
MLSLADRRYSYCTRWCCLLPIYFLSAESTSGLNLLAGQQLVGTVRSWSTVQMLTRSFAVLSKSSAGSQPPPTMRSGSAHSGIPPASTDAWRNAPTLRSATS